MEATFDQILVSDATIKLSFTPDSLRDRPVSPLSLDCPVPALTLVPATVCFPVLRPNRGPFFGAGPLDEPNSTLASTAASRSRSAHIRRGRR